MGGGVTGGITSGLQGGADAHQGYGQTGTMMGMQQAPAANQFANNQYGGGI